MNMRKPLDLYQVLGRALDDPFKSGAVPMSTITAFDQWRRERIITRGGTRIEHARRNMETRQ